MNSGLFKFRFRGRIHDLSNNLLRVRSLFVSRILFFGNITREFLFLG